MHSYNFTMNTLIAAGGGVVDGKFVSKPGVLVLATHSGLTLQAKALFETLGLDMSQSEAMLLGEFGARLTYLAFPNETYDSKVYHSMLIDKLGHLSSYSLPLPAVLIAGCSVEAGQEFVAHHEAQIARLTSSATKAQDDPFFALQGNFSEQQIMKDFLQQILSIPRDTIASLPRESRNMLAPACKATAMVVGMNIKDWRKVLKSRQSTTGVESEVMALAARTQNQLACVYPSIIDTVKDVHV